MINLVPAIIAAVISAPAKNSPSTKGDSGDFSYSTPDKLYVLKVRGAKKVVANDGILSAGGMQFEYSAIEKSNYSDSDRCSSDSALVTKMIDQEIQMFEKYVFQTDLRPQRSVEHSIIKGRSVYFWRYDNPPGKLGSKWSALLCVAVVDSLNIVKLSVDVPVDSNV